MARSHRTDGGARVPERLAGVLSSDEGRAAYARLIAACRDAGGACRLGPLARELADDEGSAAYRESYLRLRREYVPTLVTLGVVEYDAEHGVVRLRGE